MADILEADESSTSPLINGLYNLLLSLVKYYYIIFILHLVVFIGY